MVSVEKACEVWTITIDGFFQNLISPSAEAI